MPRSLILLLCVVMTLATTLLTGCPEPVVNPLPVARFVATPVSGQPPLTVQFSDVSAQGATTIRSWVWRFGDGSTSTRMNPSKTYFKPGDYTVSLSVTNSYGEQTTTEEAYIRVIEPASFLSVGPEGGEIYSQGVVLTVPPGALEETVVYGVAPQEEGFPLNGTEPLLLASKAYQITHSASSNKLYAVSPTGSLQAATLEIPFFPEAVPVADRVAGKVIILARQPDGFTIPIIGEVKENRLIADISGLPASAQYAVVLREEGFLGTEAVDGKANAPLDADWENQWRVAISLATLQQLTALRIGDIGNTLPYDRRDYSEEELEETGDILTEKVKEIHIAMRDSGLRCPTLVTTEEAYTAIFYNINPSYTTMYENFRDQIFAYSTYGALVIDPQQLITVSKHNDAVYTEDPLNQEDYKQELSFANAFAQALFGNVFQAYDYPSISLPSPSDKDEAGDAQLVNFLDGLEQGLTAWFGQWADDLDTARTFDSNEYMLLGPSLLYPFDENIAGYAVANQDLFSYIPRAYALTDPLSYIANNVAGNFGILEQIRRDLLQQEDQVNELDFEGALEVVYGAMDTAFTRHLATPLGDLFWELARDRGAENSEAAKLRASDENREPFHFVEDRFNEDEVLSKTLKAPTDSAEYLYEDTSELYEIAPLSSQPVLFPINPMASEITLSFDTDAWEDGEDSDMRIDVAVYKPGFEARTLRNDGYDTDDDDINDSLRLESFQEDKDSCYSETTLLIINKSFESSYSVSVSASTYCELAPNSEAQVLREYLQACDPEYTYQLEQSISLGASGVTKHVLRMVSGVWRSENEVNYDSWRHYLTILEPPQITSNNALLLTTGGNITNSVLTVSEALQNIAVASKSVVAILQANPIQPLYFEDEILLSEDEILAHSFDAYLSGFEEGSADKSWPALLPMTRAILRAMDATQYFMEFEKPGDKVEVKSFALSGVAKRGWASWLAAASDPERVCALMPVACDLLNLPEQMEHQYNAYGEYAEALQTYVDARFIGPIGSSANRIAQEEGDSLMAIIDPISYVDKLDMPKFILSASSDQFTLPDATRYFRDQLLGETHFYVAPNIDQGLSSSSSFDVDDGTMATLGAYYASMTRGVTLPEFTWSFEGANGIVLESSVKPLKVTLWQAENTSVCDFRLTTIGASWLGIELEGECVEVVEGEEKADAEGETEGEDGLLCDIYHYNAEVDTPSLGWKAFYVEIVFPGPDANFDVDYAFTTPVQIIPDI